MMCNHGWSDLTGSMWQWCVRCGAVQRFEVNAQTGGLVYGETRTPTTSPQAVNERIPYVNRQVYNPGSPIELTSKEASILQNEGKIHAIKELRGRVGCGLKEAKDAVEAFQSWGNPSSPNYRGSEMFS
jgi:hypothetical protein